MGLPRDSYGAVICRKPPSFSKYLITATGSQIGGLPSVKSLMVLTVLRAATGGKAVKAWSLAGF